jgi:hypothetical protein
MLSIVKLISSLCDLFMKIEKRAYPLPIFNTKTVISNLANVILENLWIKDGNIMQGDIFACHDTMLSPFVLDGEKGGFEAPKREIVFKLFQKIGSMILNVKPPIQQTKGRDYAYAGTHNPILKISCSTSIQRYRHVGQIFCKHSKKSYQDILLDSASQRTCLCNDQMVNTRYIT